jgi:uncharacterized membrane protein YgdD (TMEM256/DUF423 family)
MTAAGGGSAASDGGATPAPGLALCLGVAAGATGCALGAFGAHALRARLDPGMLEIYRTGVLYQMFHALALLAVAALGPRLGRPRLTAVLFAAGIVVFSGSLYTLAISGVRAWGAVTPIGGLCFIAAWLSMVVFRRRAHRT